MNAKQIGLSVLLADFLALTAYAVYEYGYIGFFELATANLATTVALVDLVIALSLVLVWMVRDARARGVSAVPYVVLTLALGSAGPLAYLIRHVVSDQGVETAAAPAPAARRA
jgi:hypothetical protein